MIIDRSHLRWGLAAGAVTVLSFILYGANVHPGLLPIPLPGWIGPRPPVQINFGSTPLGLVFGTLALFIFLFAALLGWRRKHPSWRIGRMQFWLKGHIWLTLVTIPFVACHCGFKSGGPMTQFLLWLYAIVMISGLYGLALQHILPRFMRDSLPDEVIFEQIPYIREQLLKEARTLRDMLVTPSAPPAIAPVELVEGVAKVASVPDVASPLISEAVITFIDLEVLPYLTAPRSLGRLRSERVTEDIFRVIKLHASVSAHGALDQLEDYCGQKRRLDLQVRLQHWLHGWVLVHAPVSFLLIIITLWHVLIALFVY